MSASSAPSVRLLRHATLVVEYGDQVFLVDPMLAAPETSPPIENSPNDRRNPLVPLPDVDLAAVDAVLVTHLHTDHLDDAAVDRLPADLPVFCQPADEDALRERGFRDVRAVEDTVESGPVELTRSPGRHGHGDLAAQMGPVSGFVLDSPGQPPVYLAGDTVWTESVASVIEAHEPAMIVLNAGAAQFTEGEPITMTDADVRAVCEAAPGATVVAVHMEAINHCLQTRAELAAALSASPCEGHLRIPADGETIPLE